MFLHVDDRVTLHLGYDMLVFRVSNHPGLIVGTEVLIAVIQPDGRVAEERTMLLPQASVEKLCHMILTEDVGVVVCGGIEEEYYQFLTWKRVRVIDSVIGSCEKALQHLRNGALQPGDILLP